MLCIMIYVSQVRVFFEVEDLEKHFGAHYTHWNNGRENARCLNTVFESRDLWDSIGHGVP